MLVCSLEVSFLQTSEDFMSIENIVAVRDVEFVDVEDLWEFEDMLALERRHRKRSNAVAAIQKTSEYEAVKALYRNNELEMAAPLTPDANDMCSKRNWERKVQRWRTSLQKLQAQK